MNILACLAGIAFLAIFIGGIVGFGWLVLQPLGKIKTSRVKRARFNLLDLFWLMILLQLPLAGFAFVQTQSRRIEEWMIAILVLVCVGTIVAWATMTSALSQAGVMNKGKRAAAVLVLVPMIGVVAPIAIIFQCFIVSLIVNHQFTDTMTFSVSLVAETILIASIFGCRRLSQWIASGAIEFEESQPQQ